MKGEKHKEKETATLIDSSLGLFLFDLIKDLPGQTQLIKRGEEFLQMNKQIGLYRNGANKCMMQNTVLFFG